MIGLPRSWIATTAGVLLGISLGIPGVILGVLTGRLLDSVLADIRARIVISSLLTGKPAPSSPGSWRACFRHPLRAAYTRDARAMGFGSGFEEYVVLISLAVEFHKGASIGVEPPARLCDQIAGYLRARSEAHARSAHRLCMLVYRASRGVPPSERLRLLAGYAGDKACENHIDFLRSLLPDYPDGYRILGVATAGDPVIEAAPAAGVPISPRLVWDDNASRRLGLDDFASEAEVRAAFRAKARSLHPDVQGHTADFIALREAYETLLSRFGVRFEDQVPEDDRKDPRSHARSDTHC
ncbi:MAG: J domain-containing protein [Spirochaetales bacterium]